MICSRLLAIVHTSYGGNNAPEPLGNALSVTISATAEARYNVVWWGNRAYKIVSFESLLDATYIALQSNSL